MCGVCAHPASFSFCFPLIYVGVMYCVWFPGLAGLPARTGSTKLTKTLVVCETVPRGAGAHTPLSESVPSLSFVVKHVFIIV